MWLSTFKLLFDVSNLGVSLHGVGDDIRRIGQGSFDASPPSLASICWHGCWRRPPPIPLDFPSGERDRLPVYPIWKRHPVLPVSGLRSQAASAHPVVGLTGCILKATSLPPRQRGFRGQWPSPYTLTGAASHAACYTHYRPTLSNTEVPSPYR